MYLIFEEESVSLRKDELLNELTKEMDTINYQEITPLQIALGVYMGLSKKAKKEFKKALAELERSEYDVTKTKAYKESMRDVEEGRVHEVGSVEELKAIYDAL